MTGTTDQIPVLVPRSASAVEPLRAARLRVDAALLEKLLLIPEDWTVRHVRVSDWTYDDAVILIVEGPSLDPVDCGQVLPELRGIYTKHADGSVTAKFEKP